MILKGLSKKTYLLEGKPFSSGTGEGDIYGITNMPDHVAKVYHEDRLTPELEEKLQVMCRRPPSQQVLTQIAWPMDVVYDANKAFRGFVMRRLNITDDLGSIYVYPPQKNIAYQAKVIIAQNICAVISEIHKAGFVFGDFNPRNIGIDLKTCLVAFLDTDSYHITDGTRTYRCTVCQNGYVAPELLKKCEAYEHDSYAQAPLPTFTQETDNFSLAIHIFRLLMNGFSPFTGIREDENASTASPGVGNQAIKRDSYCFKPGNKPQSVAVPPLSILPIELADLFTRAFMYGRIDPAQRPTAAEWHEALSHYEGSLVSCPNNSAHMYQRGLPSYPWCEADNRYAAALLGPDRQVQRKPSISQKSFSSSVIYVPPAQPGSSPAPAPGSGTSGNNVSHPKGRQKHKRSRTFRKRSSTGHHIEKFIQKGLPIVMAVIVGCGILFNGIHKEDTSYPAGILDNLYVCNGCGKEYVNQFPYLSPWAGYPTVLPSRDIVNVEETASNDSISEAMPVDMFQRVTGNLSSRDDMDFYRFTIDQTGNVSFYFSFDGSTGYTYLWDAAIYGTDGVTVLRSGSIPIQQGLEVDFDMGEVSFAPGTYYLEILAASGWNPFIGYADTNYHITFRPQCTEHLSVTPILTAEPTCFHTGELTTVCDRCDEVISTESLDPINHIWSTWKLEEENVLSPILGNYSRVCALCGEKETDTLLFHFIDTHPKATRNAVTITRDEEVVKSVCSVCGNVEVKSTEDENS